MHELGLIEGLEVHKLRADLRSQGVEIGADLRCAFAGIVSDLRFEGAEIG